MLVLLRLYFPTKSKFHDLNLKIHTNLNTQESSFTKNAYSLNIDNEWNALPYYQ